MDNINYFAVVKPDGEIIGFINLKTNETIQKEGYNIVLGYGEPAIENDYLKSER